MLNVYDLEMTIKGRAREVEEELRREGLVRSARQSMSAGAKPGQRMNGLRGRVETKGFGAGLAGPSSRGQYIEDYRCYCGTKVHGQPM